MGREQRMSKIKCRRKSESQSTKSASCSSSFVLRHSFDIGHSSFDILLRKRIHSIKHRRFLGGVFRIDVSPAGDGLALFLLLLIAQAAAQGVAIELWRRRRRLPALELRRLLAASSF